MKHKKSIQTNKKAIYAGALALMALTPRTHAQTAVDNLLNKLEQKGVLTVNEAQELRAENETNSVDDFNKAFNSKFTVPDWVTNYKFTGDLRGRFDDVSTDSPFTAGHDNNMRLRYRLRAGLVVSMVDNMQVGFRLGSDDSASTAANGGNPLSNNSTFQFNGSKKFVYIDAAYGRWMPITNDTWTATGIIGKMDNPFVASAMLFDPDYTPEGAAAQASYKPDNYNTFLANGAVFVIDQFNTRGPFLYGMQGIWNATWTPHVATSAGLSVYGFGDQRSIGLKNPGTATPYDTNLGNTIAGGTFARNYSPVVGSGNLTYTFDSFPFYPTAFPVRVGCEFMENPSAGSNNKGWWGGVTFGKAAKKGTWDISYRFQYLQADAWWDQIVDDDNIAFFATSATAGTAVGGTDVKGSLIKADYALTDGLMFSFTCYANSIINKNIAGAITPAGIPLSTDSIHVMADLMWKF